MHMGVPEGEEREKGAKRLFKEIMAENIPNLGRKVDIQIYEDQMSPNRINPKETTPRHIIIKWSKVKIKERILIAAIEHCSSHIWKSLYDYQ